jgi:hypothetical protein
MAIVGDGRRLATELVVISASATQEMYATGALVLLVVVSAFPSAAEGVARGEGLSAGASIVLTKSLPSLVVVEPPTSTGPSTHRSKG